MQDSRRQQTRQFQLEDFLPYRLSRVSNLISRGIAATYQDEYGLSVAEWRVMAVIGAQPDLTASEVIAVTAMDKVAISRAVKSLVARDLMERHIPDQDRRSRRLALTRAGARIYTEVIRRARDYEQELLADFGQKELDAFNRILDQLEGVAKGI